MKDWVEMQFDVGQISYFQCLLCRLYASTTTTLSPSYPGRKLI